MKRKFVIAQAALAIGLMMLVGSASATLTYFDAQIVDIDTGKKVVPANTVMCHPFYGCSETAFTTDPHPTDPDGNWTLDQSGSDGLWRQRANVEFGNPDASGAGTIYESRGQYDGGGDPDPNTEDLPVLKTTISVPLNDQGTTVGVYALFWRDTSNWQLAACLECVQDVRMPLYRSNAISPPGYVFGVYDVGSGDPDGLGSQYIEMNGTTTSDPTGNRSLWAAWLGNIVLGDTLTVYVGDGPPTANGSDAGSHNGRTWYDGIAYGETKDLEPLTCDIPEPAAMVLLAIGVAGFGLLRRRS